MSSFLRSAGTAAILLSFGLSVQALHALSNVKIAAPCGTDVVGKALIQLVVGGDFEIKLKGLLAIMNLVEVKAAMIIMVILFKGCVNEFLSIGASVLDADAKSSVVACIYTIIALLDNICLQIPIKFGITFVADLFVDIDVCVRALLANLDVCITDILAPIVKACVSITVAVLASIKLDTCAAVLAAVVLNN